MDYTVPILLATTDPFLPLAEQFFLRWRHLAIVSVSSLDPCSEYQLILPFGRSEWYEHFVASREHVPHHLAPLSVARPPGSFSFLTGDASLELLVERLFGWSRQVIVEEQKLSVANTRLSPASKEEEAQAERLLEEALVRRYMSGYLDALQHAARQHKEQDQCYRVP